MVTQARHGSRLSGLRDYSKNCKVCTILSPRAPFSPSSRRVPSALQLSLLPTDAAFVESSNSLISRPRIDRIQPREPARSSPHDSFASLLIVLSSCSLRELRRAAGITVCYSRHLEASGSL